MQIPFTRPSLIKISKSGYSRHTRLDYRIAAFIFAVLLSQSPQAAETTQTYNIPAQSLNNALMKFASKSKLVLLFNADKVRGMKANSLEGKMPPSQALDKLLQGSGMAFRFVDAGTVTIEPDRNFRKTATPPEQSEPQSNSGEGQVMPKVTVEADADNPYDDPTWQTDPYNTDYVLPKATAGTKTNTPVMETPLNVQVISKQVLKDQQVIRLDQALKNVSGVTTGSRSNADSRSVGFNTGNGSITLRGFRSETFFRNGFRLLEGAASREVANLESIDVVKGPAAVLYGLVEPGGMVNVTTKQPTTTPYYALKQQFGSYDFYRTTADATGPLTKDDSLLYRLNLSYENSGSFREFVSNDNVFLAPVIKWNISPKTQATLELEYQHQEQANDTGFFPTANRHSLQPIMPISTNYGEPSLGQQDTYYIGANWSHQFNDDWSLKHQFSFNRAENHTPRFINPFWIFGENVHRFVTYNMKSNTDTYATLLDLTGHFDTWGLKHTLLIGGDYYRIDSESDSGQSSWVEDENTGYDLNPTTINIFHPVHPGTNFPPRTNPNDFTFAGIGTGKTDQYGLYFQDQIELPYQVHIMGGIRYQYIDQTSTFINPGFESNDGSAQDAVTPRVGLLWQPQKWLSLYANYSESFGANSGRIWPSRSPVPPTSAEQYEGGVKVEFFGGRLRATLAYYDLTKTNVETGDPDQTHNCGQGPGDCSLVIGAIRSRGPELDIQGEILPGWNVIATYAQTEAHIEEAGVNDQGLVTGDRMWGVPRNTASFWTTYEAQEGFLKGLQIGGGVTLQDSQRHYPNSFPGELPLNIPGYATVDLMAGYGFEVGKTKITAQLNINNLLDKHYFTGAYVRGTPGIPDGYGQLSGSIGIPRTFMGSINIEY